MKPSLRVIAVAGAVLAASLAFSSCSRKPATPYRTFATPEDAVKALADAVKKGSIADLQALFGPDSDELIASADAATARRNREVFAAAFRERWHLQQEGARSATLVVGNEEWPFPIPVVKNDTGWHFDVAAGKEEVLERRIGRNELAVISICRTYVAAQRLYAQKGHDGQPAGLFAQAFRSDPGRENGLYWRVTRSGQKRSPLGDLVADAAQEGRVAAGDGAQPAPFHGYYFRILTAQGPAAPGGAKAYIVKGRMSGGFALVAWPAEYDASGVMTFVVNADGVVHQKDLGPDTAAAIRNISAYNPDASWGTVQ